MPGEFLWGYNAAADEWYPVAVDANGRLQVDTTPGDKSVIQIMNAVAVAAGATSAHGDCDNIDLLSGASSLAIQVQVAFLAGATQGCRVHIRTSRDGTNWDTQDLDWFPMPVAPALPGDVVQTEIIDTAPAYIDILVENIDPAQAVTVSAWAIEGP